MLKSYFHTALRSLIRNKEYSLINIAGLAVSIASCLLLFFIIQYELSFDAFHSNKERIFRITNQVNFPEGIDYGQGVPAPFPDAMRMDFPQLEQVGTIYSMPNVQIDALDGEKQVEYKETLGVFFAEPQFFKIFDFEWLHGSPDALNEPNTAVITQETAERYFGSWNAAVGKSVEFNNNYILKVVGILKNVPPNTDFPLKVVMSFKTRGQEDSSWGSISSRRQCYILLDEHTSPDQIRNLMPAFEKKHHPVESNILDHYTLQRLEDMHFDARYGNFNGRVVDRLTLWSLGLIGVLLIVTASINFVNLAVARVMKRAKEVGVRKVLGSSQRQLASQFFGETFVILVVASLLAILATEVALPSVRQLLNLPASFRSPGIGQIVLLVGAVVVLVTFVSGYYPARVLGGFKPVQALKSKINNQMIGGVSLRKGLVVMQFAIAQVLVIATLIILQQLDFFRNAPMGFEKDWIILFTIPTDSMNQKKLEAFRQTLLKEPEVEKVAFSFSAPLSGSNRLTSFRFNNSGQDAPFEVHVKFSDKEYFDTYNMPLVAGRLYEPSDMPREVVVNETFLRKFGITTAEEGLGKTITLDGATLPIVGVLKDFHLSSLADKIEPLTMRYRRAEFRTVSVKLQSVNWQPVIEQIGSIYQSFYPEDIFQSRFFNENIDRLYPEEKRLASVTRIFSCMAIFISSLGLYGLISFMAVQRTREVGIRKVLGASIRDIIFLFYKDFIVLVLIAFLMSAPFTGYFMSDWLNTFAYKVNLSPWIFISALSLSVVVSMITISFQSVKSALANPIDSLRVE